MDQDHENLASLKIIKSEDESLIGAIIALEKPYTRLGRAADNDVILPDDKTTSRFHAAIEQREGSFYVVDLASTNGTFLRGIRLLPSMPELLKNGDVIQIGGTTLRFEAAKGYPEASTATESPVFSRTFPGDPTTDAPPPDVKKKKKGK